MDIFLELSIVVGLAAGVSIAMRLLKQPLIIGYILTGVLVGPLVLDTVHSEDTLDALANFGIALLLFIIGLGLNPRVIREVGRVAILTGVGQVAFTTSAGLLIARGLGYDWQAALYIAVALAFSSTIIILKLLSDKKEQHRLYGKISIGFLLVQDILATIALIMASASGNGGLSPGSMLELLLRGVWLGLGLYLVVTLVMPRLRTLIAGSQELLFILLLRGALVLLVFSGKWGFR